MPLDLGRIKALSEPLIERLSERLGVAKRTVRFRLVPNAFVARTAVTWPPAPASVAMSEESIEDRPVLAHELTHCLVPTRSLLLAEGFATWMGCRERGDCSDFFFPQATVDEAVAAHVHELTPLRALAAEFTDRRTLFDVGLSFRSDVRLAHLSAASFVRWCTALRPELARRTAQPENRDPVALLETTLGASLEELERGWLRSLPPSPIDSPPPAVPAPAPEPVGR